MIVAVAMSPAVAWIAGFTWAGSRFVFVGVCIMMKKDQRNYRCRIEVHSRARKVHVQKHAEKQELTCWAVRA